MNRDHSFADKISGLNQVLREKYASIQAWTKEGFRQYIEDQAGPIKKLRKLSPEELEAFGIVVGLDGSVNKLGGAYPHYVELYRGLALSTRHGYQTSLEEIYTPLLEEREESDQEEEEEGGDDRKRRLAEIEMKTAIAYMKAHPAHYLMMDGGLIRYRVYTDLWEEFTKTALEKNVITFGVIKDIKTSVLGQGEETKGLYDRELLFGKLDYGDVIYIDEEKNKKVPSGLTSAFLKTSKDIQVVGLDLLKDQEEELENVCNLVFSLTPSQGRGVPLWIDIVDHEVKITDDQMRALFQSYMDRDLFERLFVSERDLRRM